LRIQGMGQKSSSGDAQPSQSHSFLKFMVKVWSMPCVAIAYWV